MEPSEIILILAPILFPIAIELGIDPIHFGIIMVVNMEIGLITPRRFELICHFGRHRNATQRHHPSRPTVADDLVGVLDDYYLYTSSVVVAAECVGDALGDRLRE
ncbi:TRAP-type C4-dicarboxylate transport system, large permease component [Vibrio casei]|nr:TRAP-type C4-dicarboxylate transport system, large permease component [Vibrio casei]